MGISSSKKRSPNEEEFRGLMEKIKLLQKEINEIMERNVNCERGEMEWKEERKRLKEEVKRLRNMLEEKEERIRGMEDGIVEWKLMGNGEKWKQLYLAIKTELDHLIQTTNSDVIYLRAKEEEMIEELKGELKAKEETIEALKVELCAVKNEEMKSKREMDILRQSLRIISHKKNATNLEKGFSRILKL